MDPPEVWDAGSYEVHERGKKDFAGKAGALNEVRWAGAGTLLCDLELLTWGWTVSLKSGVQMGVVNLAAIAKESVCCEEAVTVCVVT